MAVLGFVALACGGSTAPVLTATPTPTARVSPAVRAVPPPRTFAAPGAGVAWFAAAGGTVGISPDGRELSLPGTPIHNASNGSTGLRSADGGQIYIAAGGKLEVASAADGHVLRSIDLPWSGQLQASISRDGRWLWIMPDATGTRLLLVDAERGAVVASGSVTLPSGGSGGAFGAALLALLDGRLLLMPPGRSEILLLSAHGQGVGIDARTSAASASPLSCNSPDPQMLHLVADGTAVAGYCAFDGAVWWLDLGRFQVTDHTPARIGNPFWGAPAFSADGRMLYVYDSWDGYATEIDLVLRRLLKSTQALRPALALRLPFIQEVQAKGPNFSAALSADGETLFTTGTRGSSDGLYALSTSNLGVRAHWLQGRKVQAVWAGSDGAALFAMEASGKALDIVDLATGSVRTLERASVGGFTVA
ncbi:MAG TPA: hypothetical protein VKI99_19490 [Candidatus Dormibacteraeota bacterium]|nr:hypothetical protein [Candidatus Dormibacteraeota bacterium]